MAIHPDLKPLSFLLGRWEGAEIGGYPTIESFQFGQEISFSHIRKDGEPAGISTLMELVEVVAAQIPNQAMPLHR